MSAAALFHKPVGSAPPCYAQLRYGRLCEIALASKHFRFIVSHLGEKIVKIP